MDLKEEQQLGKAVYSHWYYISKGKAMQRYLGAISVPEVLDVGAGSGFFPVNCWMGIFVKVPFALILTMLLRVRNYIMKNPLNLKK